MSTVANMRHALILTCVYPINDVAFAICNEYRYSRSQSMNHTGRKLNINPLYCNILGIISYDVIMLFKFFKSLFKY